MFLCSNKVTLQHPFYNTPEGKRQWENAPVVGDNRVKLTEENDTVLLNVEIALPSKFNTMMQEVNN
jgi:hypothetical protein